MSEIEEETKNEYQGDGDYEDMSYEALTESYEEEGNDVGESDYEFIQKIIDVPSALIGLRKEIEDKAIALGLNFNFTTLDNSKLLLRGVGHVIKDLESYIEKLAGVMSKPLTRTLMLGEKVHKEIPFSSSFKHFKPVLEKLAETLEVQIEYNFENMFTIHGFERRVGEFSAALFEKERAYGLGDLLTQDINLSTFQRIHQAKIQEKALALGLTITFGYDKVSASGQKKIIDQLISYLTVLETDTKKQLFPKYWDFSNHESLALIQVFPGTDEYKLVTEPFIKTIQQSKVNFVSIKRIQNRYLMDQFITVISKKVEDDPEKINMRKLLFHGTRLNHPELIYDNYETGFDLQYAHYGSYGKGLYFAGNASYSNGYVYMTKEGTKVMFLVDVFVGKACPSGQARGTTPIVKAPNGYDSIEETSQNFWIVYHNFYCYPLYLIEYK